MTVLDTRPEQTEATSLRRRFVWLGASSVTVVVLAVAALTITGGDTETTPGPSLASPPAASTGAVGGFREDAAQPMAASGLSNDPTNRRTGFTPSVLRTSADPLAYSAATACDLFRGGATVADVAAWFETDLGHVGSAEQALFHDMLLRALTEVCPEVVPTG